MFAASLNPFQDKRIKDWREGGDRRGGGRGKGMGVVVCVLEKKKNQQIKKTNKAL